MLEAGQFLATIGVDTPEVWPSEVCLRIHPLRNHKFRSGRVTQTGKSVKSSPYSSKKKISLMSERKLSAFRALVNLF